MDIAPNERADKYFSHELTPEDAHRFWSRRNRVYEAHETGVLSDALLDYYQDAVGEFYTIEMNGDALTRPILSPDDWRQPTRDLSSVIGTISHEMETRYDSASLMNQLEGMGYCLVEKQGIELPTQIDLGEYLYNGLTYGVTRSRLVDGKPVFDIGLTDYFSYLSTSEALLQDTYDVLLTDGTVGTERRDQLIPTVDDLLSLSNTVNKVGMVVLLGLAREDGGVDILVSRRSNIVLEYPGHYSLVPAGAAQPLHGDLYDADLELTILREFAEEVLDFPETTSLDFEEDVDATTALTAYKQCEPLNKLYTTLHEGEIDLWYTNASVSALNGKFDMGGLLYIHDNDTARWVRENMSSNWESSDYELIRHPVSEVPELYTSHTLAPSAYVTLFEGLALLRDEYGVPLGFDIETGL